MWWDFSGKNNGIGWETIPKWTKGICKEGGKHLLSLKMFLKWICHLFLKLCHYGSSLLCTLRLIYSLEVMNHWIFPVAHILLFFSCCPWKTTILGLYTLWCFWKWLFMKFNSDVCLTLIIILNKIILWRFLIFPSFK